jgi:hypothetical protein
MQRFGRLACAADIIAAHGFAQNVNVLRRTISLVLAIAATSGESSLKSSCRSRLVEGIRWPGVVTPLHENLRRSIQLS